jgi:hypothetical protein
MQLCDYPSRRIGEIILSWKENSQRKFLIMHEKILIMREK